MASRDFAHIIQSISTSQVRPGHRCHCWSTSRTEKLQSFLSIKARIGAGSATMDLAETRPSDFSKEDRTVNSTFANLAPARNRPTVRFGFLFTLCRGLTRLVNGRRRGERVGSCGEFCYRRRPLPNRIECGSAIERREGMALALSGDECRS